MAGGGQFSTSRYTAPLAPASVDWDVLTALGRQALGQETEPWYKVASTNRHKRQRPNKKQHAVKTAVEAPRADGPQQSLEGAAPTPPPPSDDFEVHATILDLEAQVPTSKDPRAEDLFRIASSHQIEDTFLPLNGHLRLASHGRLQLHQQPDPETDARATRTTLLTVPPLRAEEDEGAILQAYGFDLAASRTAHWLNALLYLVGSGYSGASRFKAEVSASFGWRTDRMAAARTLLGEPREELNRKVLVVRLAIRVFTSPERLLQPLDERLLGPFRLVYHHIYPPPAAVQADNLEPLRLQEFYESLQPAPPISQELATKLQPPEVGTQLFDFQLRSVAHLLKREGAAHIDPDLHDAAGDPEGFWERVDLKGAGGEPVWVCRILGRVERFGEGHNSQEDSGDESGRPPSCLGFERANAILADEMGLGKTLDTIALICLNRRFEVSLKRIDEHARLPTKATLIVVPDLLLSQWCAELHRHAPSLKVKTYRGWRHLEDEHRVAHPTIGEDPSAGESTDAAAMLTPVEWFCHQLGDQQIDVVLTGFQAVSLDFDVSQPPPSRASRSGKLHDNSGLGLRTPLVRLEWWRIVLDETQMADPSGSTKIASTMRNIARIHALSVSGTPAKAEIADLGGSLDLIGVKLSARAWKLVQAPAYRSLLLGMFHRVCIRTTKRSLQRSPPERYIVPASLNAVEMQYYADTRDHALQALGITPDGFPATANWTLDVPLLRAAISRLRQRCTLSIHLMAKGGQKLSEAPASRKIMTLEEALQQLHLDAQAEVWTQRIQLASLQIDKAQLITRSVNINWDGSPEQDLLYPDRRRDIAYLNDVNQSLKEYETELQEQAPRQESPESNSDEEDRPISKFELGRRSRLRDILSLRHRCNFLLGNIYFFSHEHAVAEAFKEDMGRQMDAAYLEATTIRRQLLSQLLDKANKAVYKASTAMKESKISDFSQLEVDEIPMVGLVGQAVKQQANTSLEVLNENAELLWNWRGKIAELLLTPLETTEDADGNEYEAALAVQAKCDVYLTQLELALADRREFLVEQRALVTAAVGKVPRKTQRALDAGSERLMDKDEVAAVFGAEMEKELANELYGQRQRLREQQSREGRPLKGLIIDFGAALSRATRPEEEQVLRNAQDYIRATLKTQVQLLDAFEQEMQILSAGFNARVSYFKDLQVLSDTLDSVDRDIVSLERQDERITAETVKLRSDIKLGEARVRYLQTLQSSGKDMHSDRCVLCLTDLADVRGGLVLLKGCGHDLCVACYSAYRGGAGGRRCLVCRYPIAPGDAQKVVLAPAVSQNKIIKQEAITGEVEAIPKLGDMFRLPPNIQEIAAVDVAGQWSAKITSLLQNILLIKAGDPTIKHIVFSAWRDAFVAIKSAFDLNSLRWVDLDDRRKGLDPVERFAKPDFEILLMNGERSVSGLDLTAASVVHLVEPFINGVSFESQAVGRVDRLSQRRATQVYCYCTESTIETKILLRGVAQGTSSWTKTGEADKSVPTSVARRGGDDFGRPEELLDLLL